MLTYITTYCDNPEYLEQVLGTMRQCNDPRLKLLVVDDCSDQSPAELIRACNDSRMSLYRINEDLGFNSHGGRNLAMQQTTTEWNLLTDIDFQVVDIQNIIDQVADGELEPTSPHFFSVDHVYAAVKRARPYVSINDFLVTKTAFWKAKGYDPEFYGWHHGDRSLLHRLMNGNTASVVFGSHLNALRSPFANTEIDPELKGNQERYSEDRATFYVSPESQIILPKLEAAVIDRHASGSTEVEYFPFTWEQVI